MRFPLRMKTKPQIHAITKTTKITSEASIESQATASVRAPLLHPPNATTAS
jgi:hypothetical protein